MPFLDNALSPIWSKVQSGTRLNMEDARTLYATTDLLGLGWMAKQVKEKRWGKKAFYVLNQKLEPTNVCVLSCKFCDFATKRSKPNAYEMTIEDMVARCSGEGVSEIHISGGMPPEWTLDNYLAIIRALRQAYPTVAIKAFTAVEVEWAARISKRSIENVLLQLKEAGLTALPGGGAEVFSERVRQELFPFKIGAATWLEVHKTAHRLGIPSNATLLYGHIETPEECWQHLELLRQAQDEAPGFMSFIPLAFQPGTTGLSVHSPTVVEDLKQLAIARLYLDNFPHIKAYWITLGVETASTGLHFGADDIDGTIGEEKIMHAAGATSPAGLARERLEQVIREAGCEPVERDGLYNFIVIRVGYIPYLNMAPFHNNFGPQPVDRAGIHYDFIPCTPRTLGLAAEHGNIDAGALSLVDSFRLAETFEPLSDLGIGVKGPAQSVLVFSKGPLKDLSGICAVTDETATSIKLLQMILEERYQRTGISYGRIASSLMFDGAAEAVLLIGNEALQAKKEGIPGFSYVTDLGTEWLEWQKTPFVFARWMVRKSVHIKVKQELLKNINNALLSMKFNNVAVLSKVGGQVEKINMLPGLYQGNDKEKMTYWSGFSYHLTPAHEQSIETFEKWVNAHV